MWKVIGCYPHNQVILFVISWHIRQQKNNINILCFQKKQNEWLQDSLPWWKRKKKQQSCLGEFILTLMALNYKTFIVSNYIKSMIALTLRVEFIRVQFFLIL